MAEIVNTTDLNGLHVALPISDLETAIINSGAGFPLTFTVVYRGVTYVQTMTYDGGNKLVNVSKYVAQ